MKLNFSGEEKINSDPLTSTRLLTDINVIAKTIPDAEEVKIISSNQLEAKVKVRIAMISASLLIRMMIMKDAEDSISLQTTAKGAGSSIEIKSSFKIVPSDSNTIVNWSADAEISGLIAGLGSQTLKLFADKYIKQIIQNIHSVIESETKRLKSI